MVYHLIRRSKLGDRKKTQVGRELDVITEMEISVMYLWSKGHQVLWATARRLEEKHGTDSPLVPPEGTNTADTFISDV